MNLQLPTGKRALVDKANSTVIAVVAVAAVVVIFCLVASKALWDQSRFLSRVIDKKETALNQLEENVNATDTLVTAYTAFVQEQPNVIEGNISGDGERDGDNARIVLDALPSKYDFPALATSVEKILTDQGIEIGSIEGTDDRVEQSNMAVTNNPTPIEIPFEFSVMVSPEASETLFQKLQRSIRPIRLVEFTIDSDSDSSITLQVSAKTYYLPEKGLDIQKEVIQ